MYAYAQQTPEQKAAAQASYEAHLAAQKATRVESFKAFALMVRTGEALKLWTVANQATPDEWDRFARATVTSAGRDFSIWANLEGATVEASYAPLQDAQGRQIIARDVLPYSQKAPTVPTAKLARGPEVVAKDLYRRCVGSAEWHSLIDLMIARQAQSLQHKRETLGTAETFAQLLGQQDRLAYQLERGGSHSITLYSSPEYPSLSSVEICGDSVSLKLYSMTPEKALRVLEVLKGGE